MENNRFEIDINKLNNLDDKPTFNIIYSFYQSHQTEDVQLKVVSNYINVKLLCSVFFELNNDLFNFNEIDNVVNVSLKERKNLFEDYSRVCNLESLLFDNNDNYILIKSDDIELYEYIYDVLSFSLSKITEFNCKISEIHNLKEQIATFEALKKQVYLKKTLDLDSLNICHNLKNKKILDLNYELALLDSKKINDISIAINDLIVDNPTNILDEILNKISSMFNERAVGIIYARFVDDLTLEEVGRKYNLTRERVRQIASKVTSNKSLLRSLNRFYDSFYVLTENELFVSFDSFDDEYLKKILFMASISEKLLIVDRKKRLIFFNLESSEQVEKIYKDLPEEVRDNEVRDIYYESFENIISYNEFLILLDKYFHKYATLYCKNKLTNSKALTLLIQKYFPDGIKIYDHDELQKLRNYSIRDFGEDLLSETDRAVAARIQDNAVLIGRGIWKVTEDEIKLPFKLENRINHYILNNDMPVIPFESIFLSFKDELCEIGVTNRYQLQSIVKKFCRFKTSRDYVIKNNEISYYELVENFVRKANTPVTKAVLTKKFPGITDAVIQMICSETAVVNMNGYFVHLDNLKITSAEKNQLINSVIDIIVDDSIYNSKMIFSDISRQNSGLFNRIGINHYLQFFYLLRELFPDSFSYSRPFIARRGIEINEAYDQVLEYLLEKDEFEVEDIKEYSNVVGTIIDRYIDYIDKYNDYFIFKDRNQIIKNEKAFGNETFNNLDEVLDEFLREKDYCSLQQFYSYWKLPKINVKWNVWVLYSIIKKFSKKYSTTTSTKKLNEAIPYVYKKSFDLTKIIFGEEDICDVSDFDFDDVDNIDELL